MTIMNLIRKAKQRKSYKPASPALKGCSQKGAIVKKSFITTPRKPNSAKRKVAKVGIHCTRQVVDIYLEGMMFNKLNPHSVVLVPKLGLTNQLFSYASLGLHYIKKQINLMLGGLGQYYYIAVTPVTPITSMGDNVDADVTWKWKGLLVFVGVSFVLFTCAKLYKNDPFGWFNNENVKGPEGPGGTAFPYPNDGILPLKLPPAFVFAPSVCPTPPYPNTVVFPIHPRGAPGVNSGVPVDNVAAAQQQPLTIINHLKSANSVAANHAGTGVNNVTANQMPIVINTPEYVAINNDDSHFDL